MKVTIEISEEMAEAIKTIEDEENLEKAIIAGIQFSIDNF